MPPGYAIVAESYVMTLPQTTGLGCSDLGIVTTDFAQGITNNIPPDFNPRPKTNPSPATADPRLPGRHRQVIWHRDE